MLSVYRHLIKPFYLFFSNFTDHVNHLQKVKDSMDLWIEAFDTFGAATLMLSESFKGFFAFKPSADYEHEHPTSSPYLPVATSFAEIAKKLNRTILPSVRQLFEIRCLQPLAAILAMIGPIDALLQERKTVLLDFDSYRAKIEREHSAGRDSRHPLVIKKAMKLDDVAKRLHSLNTTICTLFEEFEKARPVTLGPEFSAFMACFFHFSSYSTELSGKVVPHLPQIASSLYVLESFIGQSFSDLYTMEGKPIGSSGSSAAPAPASQNKFIKSTASTEVPSVVLERTEFAGGSYGGYASHSTVLPADYKDEAIEQMLAGAAEAAAAAEALAEESPQVRTAALAGMVETPVDITVVVETQSVATVECDDDSSLNPPIIATFSGNFGASAQDEEASQKSVASALSESACTYLDSSNESVVSALIESAPGKLESASAATELPAPSTPPKEGATEGNSAAAELEATPVVAPVRTGFFSSFFSSPARAALPLAKPVSTPCEEEEEVVIEDASPVTPVAEAIVAPPKPQKPAELLRTSSMTMANNRSSSPLPSGFQVLPPPSGAEPGSQTNSPNPSFRNTIALARGSIEGVLSPELAERRTVEAYSSSSPLPLQKPVKPPKPSSRRTESNAEDFEEAVAASSQQVSESTPAKMDTEEQLEGPPQVATEDDAI